MAKGILKVATCQFAVSADIRRNGRLICSYIEKRQGRRTMSESLRPMENQGYLIVLKPDIYLARFESNLHIVHPEIPEEYRGAFRYFDLKKYRGISREPLEAYLQNEKDLEDLRRKGIEDDSNKEARTWLTAIVPETTLDYCDDSFIANKDDALEIYKMLDNPADWEIIHIRRNQFERNPNTLGFDIGYWGGDHFSLIADTIVTPMWHPVHPKDRGEVAEKLSILNKNLLFDNPLQASQFKEYCKSKEWSETEGIGAEFCIIQVDSVGS